ncbi:hypothetical protein BJX76DRAFT_332216 [Aspergillus varians]
MLSYASIQAFIKRCGDDLPRIDFIILNAAMMSGEFSIHESTGHEVCFQVNYLSTALLTILLLPILKAKRNPRQDKPSRITIVGSGLALSANFPERNSQSVIGAFDSPEYFSNLDRYSTTKLLLLIFISKLAPYVDPSDVVVNVADPAFVATPGLDRNIPAHLKYTNGLGRMLVARSIEAGAWAYIDTAVVKPNSTHGSWLANWEVHAFPKIMYSLEGRQASDTLWQETLADLDWAGVRGILSAMGMKNV